MKKVIKRILIVICIIPTFIGLYFCGYYFCSRIKIDEDKNTPPQMAIYLSTNGMHTDFVMPIKSEVIDWSKKIKYCNTKSKDIIQQFIAIGWGNAGFFIDVPDWDHVKPSIALKAAFGLSPSAMHATFLKRISVGGDVVKIKLSNEQYKLLVDFIVKYFQKDSNDNFINIPTENTYGENDAFYKAKGHYNIFFTCNTWTNNALAAARLRHCLWTPFQKGIFRQYE
ncbi:MAG: TIGR02117 family protein [Paludibacter sp.]|nr:TIGR02117 family protein [Paludibacter sp.]